MDAFKVIFIGDVVGSRARTALGALLPLLRQEYTPHYVITNAENSAAGFGLTMPIYHEFIYDLNVDVLTGGNHIWDKKEIFKEIGEMDRLVRPLNYADCKYGQGYRIDTVKGVRVCTINVLGRVFVDWTLNCPFRTTEALLTELKGQAEIFIVDLHAETTSEKKAFGLYFDGKVSAVLGTHTHVQTADERIMAQGTGYITDVGMVGVIDSVLGMKKETAQSKFLYGIKERFEVMAEGDVELNGCYLEIDPTTGKTLKIERIYREYRKK